MYHIRDLDEVCDLCGKANSGNNLRNFQPLLSGYRLGESRLHGVVLCIRCSLKAFAIMPYFYTHQLKEEKK